MVVATVLKHKTLPVSTQVQSPPFQVGPESALGEMEIGRNVVLVTVVAVLLSTAGEYTRLKLPRVVFTT